MQPEMGATVRHHDASINACLQANAARSGKLERRLAHVESEHHAENVDRPFDLADGDAKVAGACGQSRHRGRIFDRSASFPGSRP